MRKLIFIITFGILLIGCASATEKTDKPFAEAHDTFTTNLVKKANDQDKIDNPPEGVFNLDYFDSKVGKLAAYVSPDPGDGVKHPLIIWIVGGWGNGIDPDVENNQNGSAFREAGILMMYPSHRGANGNPGYYETLFGEIDDIVSAYEYAASLPYVDAQRIYLGGHSTGGTRVLLASEYTDKFRAVFSFGPVDEIKYHDNSQFTFDTSNKDEHIIRSPLYWLKDIKSPTFIIEGQEGNSSNLRNIEKKSKNENIHCYLIDRGDHFNILAPITRLLAQKILSDNESQPNISLTSQELQDAMKQPNGKTL